MNRLRFEDIGFGEVELSDDDSTMLMLEFTGADLGWFNDGVFDVVIGEDVAVDWARLDLYVGDLLLGDMNSDGVLNADDVANFAAALDAEGDAAQFALSSPTGRYIAGDFNDDAVVSHLDYDAFRAALLAADPSAETVLDQLIPFAQAGDFDRDGDIDADDIDLLLANLGNAIYDLTGDDIADSADVDEMVLNIVGTLYGDANLDGEVGTADLAILAANFGSSGVGWAGADFNGSAGGGTPDLAILAANFGQGAAASAVSAVSPLVPEPASAALLAVGVVGLLPRRRGARELSRGTSVQG